MEVVIDNEGSISSDSGVVLERWRKDFQTLLNSDNLETTPGHVPVFDPPHVGAGGDSLNSQITVAEVRRAIRHAKNRKATRADEIPIEVLRNDRAVYVLCTLFEKCFASGKIPAMWLDGIINPIPKCATADPRVQ